MNDREALIAIKNSLQTNLEDPREQYTSVDRNWIHTDEPLTSATYPRIQVRKRGPTNTEVISMGTEFLEWYAIIVDIQIWIKAPFKWDSDYSSGTYLQDEELIKEYQDKIWVALKADQSDLKATYGIQGLKLLESDEPYQEAQSNLYTGTTSVRVWYFKR